MKFVLFVEGFTEQKAAPVFLKSWLDKKFPNPKVGVKIVRFSGWQELIKKTPVKAKMHLEQSDVIGVIALLDLYGPTFYPENISTSDERYYWAKNHLENQVNDRRFRQYFAVHEFEAWLLSEPDIFPKTVKNDINRIANIDCPEKINSTDHPSKRLDDIYQTRTRKKYKKIVYGNQLFRKLDPDTAYFKCPHLKIMLDDMLEMAKQAMNTQC